MNESPIPQIDVNVRIAKLEKEHNLLKKYLVKLKRQVEKLTEKINGESRESDEGASNQIPELNTQIPEKVNYFSDEELQVERILLLVGFYADDETIEKPAISAEELVQRYNKGERDFSGLNLAGINLSGAN
ncbi:MAG: hypothetical protein SAL07_24330 [Oscillatoria sp. PMC 1051.18]|nr:hypothetical protein [Oscillatoria sp. PMC 1050.18]MEC5033038.1 hypothetical protein [Oscillatoria sp. PMC 1051.18]